MSSSSRAAERCSWRTGFCSGEGGGVRERAVLRWWVLVGDDRALGDGRASVGKDCVVVRASGGGVVGGAGFGGCEWLRACWLARQLQFRSKTHAQPWPPRQAGRQASKQARLASHTQVPHRLTATSQPARVDPSPLVGYRIRPVRKTVRFPDARTSIDARRSCVSSRCGICLWHYYHLSAIIHSHTHTVGLCLPSVRIPSTTSQPSLPFPPNPGTG